MPFTPYHFGPSGFLGLVFKKRLDLPVFVLANVAVDVEVLIIAAMGGFPRHRYAHTFLIGAAVGVLWGLAAYPLRGLFGKMMQLVRLRYKTSLLKMLISGILGVWLHVLIDGVYHYDVQPFWPNRKNALWSAAVKIFGYENSRTGIRLGSLALLAAALALWGICRLKRPRQSSMS